MIVFIIAVFFLQFIFPLTTTANDISNNRYNSLISAQCKARCLYEYRHHHHQQQRSVPAIFNNGKTKRLLTTNALTLPWRSIWERCPRLVTCSSCLLPCDLDPPLLLSSEQSCQAICSTLRNGECQRSCLFIQKLYQQQSNCLTDDCQSSSCSPSNDCFEKIPQPNNVTAIERKSRRTVKLKWNANRLINIEPVFYVIEAQWTLPKTENNQQDTVSKWGFVKEEVSHTKAIIRNIQRDNRWYKFRVAAVTRHGYSSFSMTTEPFRLSSSSKNESQKSLLKIAPPRNFLVKDFQLNSNTINLTLSWQQPHFPIHGYQISWESQNDPVNTIDISSSLYPLELTIPYLSMHTSYIFKIRSLIISDGDYVQTSVPLSIKYNYEENLFSIENFHMSEPYFINGLIKTNISWNKINDYRLQQYDLHWIETQCYSDVIACCYRRDAVTIENSFQLNDLRFNCTYVLNIKPIVSKIRMEKSFQIYFNVTSCQSIQIYGTIRPPCQIDNKRSSSFIPSLNLVVTRNQSGILFHWQNILSYGKLSLSFIDKRSVFVYDQLVNDTADIVYQLRIEQLPSHIERISVDLSPTITNYFLPYLHQENDRYLNVTLTLYNHLIIEQQQSILIEEYHNLNRDIQLNIISSSSSSRRRIQMKDFLSFVLLILIR